MKRSILSVLVVLISGMVFAETDYIALPRIKVIEKAMDLEVDGEGQPTMGTDFDMQIQSTYILVGDSAGVAQPVAMSGDMKLSNTGVASLQANAVVSSNITDGTIVNANVNASAAIAGSKLDLTNGTGNITVASPNVVTFGGDFVQHGRVYGTPVTVAVTNAQVLSLNNRRSYIWSQTTAVQTTNTLSNPTDSGTDVVVFNTGTGKVSIARAANFAAPVSPVVLPRYGTMHLYSPNGATWYVVGLQTNNSVTP